MLTTELVKGVKLTAGVRMIDLHHCLHIRRCFRAYHPGGEAGCEIGIDCHVASGSQTGNQPAGYRKVMEPALTHMTPAMKQTLLAGVSVRPVSVSAYT